MEYQPAGTALHFSQEILPSRWLRGPAQVQVESCDTPVRQLKVGNSIASNLARHDISIARHGREKKSVILGCPTRDEPDNYSASVLFEVRPHSRAEKAQSLSG